VSVLCVVLCCVDWWLVVGGWWLVVGGWWLVVGGWWLEQSLNNPAGTEPQIGHSKINLLKDWSEEQVQGGSKGTTTLRHLQTSSRGILVRHLPSSQRKTFANSARIRWASPFSTQFNGRNRSFASHHKSLRLPMNSGAPYLPTLLYN